ncbi:glutathione s-transferase [Cryptosporidium ubiquitum]|uniref:Glutathione s-transferase n=1 Tax=Cryptosporidium ubiquitum TaxID=857276 RepID=A0A1J4MLH8_9CRYT|nr:glutathione s-transferase [Cryptosporidium ubiquitum]OII73725.1 glutathione s-transferase [Cryptosporidium ubiquitum]
MNNIGAGTTASPKNIATKVSSELNEIYSPKMSNLIRSNAPCRLTSNRVMIPSKSTYRVILPVRDIGDLSVITYEHEIYLGNGGSLRFFLLGKQVRHRFINVPLDEENPIPSYIDSDKVPLGDLPIVKLGDLVIFDEIPCLRYLAKKLGEYGRNYYIDFVIDDVIFRCSKWRDVLMDLISRNYSELSNGNINTNKELESSISNYKLLREQLYCEFETLIASIGDKGPFIAEKNKPMICDFILFSILFDDISLIEFSETEKFNRVTLLPERSIIHKFPRLKMLFESVAILPLIDQWIKGKYFAIQIEGESSELVTPPTSLTTQDHGTNFVVGTNSFIGCPNSFGYQPPVFQQLPNQLFAHVNAGIRFFPQNMAMPINQPIFSPNNSFVSQPITNYYPFLNNQIQNHGYLGGVSSPFVQRISPSQSFKLKF